jgi:hypothetical protein
LKWCPEIPPLHENHRHQLKSRVRSARVYRPGVAHLSHLDVNALRSHVARGLFNPAGSRSDRKASNRSIGSHDEYAAGLNQIPEHAMNSTVPYDKIHMINGSLRCFAFGLLALLPLIGIPFAVISISNFRSVFFSKGTLWNPAERYLRIGLACATAGILLHLLAVAAVVIQIS